MDSEMERRKEKKRKEMYAVNQVTNVPFADERERERERERTERSAFSKGKRRKKGGKMSNADYVIWCLS